MMQHRLRRLSWPEGCEVWIAWDLSYMAFPTTYPNGGHKEWLVVCMRDNAQYEAGVVLDESYVDLKDVKKKLEQLLEDKEK